MGSTANLHGTRCATRWAKNRKVVDLDDLIQNAEAHAERLAQRVYSREGVEMVLALEDLTAYASDEEVHSSRANAEANDLLASATREVAARLLNSRLTSEPARALQLALELIAFYDFGQDATPLVRRSFTPSTSAGPGDALVNSHADTTYVTQALRSGRFIRSVNFHNTFAEDGDKLRAQLGALAERFKSIGLAELEKLTSGELWTDERPPILLVFYEGTRNHVDVAAPLLNELGLTGIFCLIPGFIDAPIHEQAGFASAHDIAINALEYPDGRLAVTWDEVRSLAAQGHAFTCHTMTHADPRADGVDLRLESVGAVKRLEEALDEEITSFVWQRGIAWGTLPRADALLQEVGIRLLVSALKVMRLPSLHSL